MSVTTATLSTAIAAVFGVPLAYALARADFRGKALVAAAVGPKEGYFTIAWDPRARLVWTSDLERDNTLLCKLKVTAR